MQKSSKLKLSLLALPLALVAVAAVGCESEEHTHTNSSEWAFNATAHWHPSTCSHDVKTNKADHNFTEKVVAPSVTSAGYTLYTCACGYSYTSDSVDSLPVEGDYRFDENGHWKTVLSGDGEDRLAKHSYTDSTVAPTCSTYGYTKHTCECGYWYASNSVQPTAHSYNETVWEHDETGHWHPALCCDAKSGTVAHNYTESVTLPTCDTKGYTRFTCVDCGYSYEGREVPEGHTYSDTLTSDEYQHWRQATCSHSAAEKTDVADHYLIGNSNVCVVCNKAVTPRLAYELSADGNYYIVTGIGCWDSTSITIPAEYRGKPVQEVGVRAFKDSNITSVTIDGSNLKKIDTEAFAGTRLSTVSLSGIEVIGTKAFAGTDITALSLGASVTSIGNAAFRDCTNLQTVSIDGSLSALSPYVFDGCTSLKSVSGTKLTSIGAQAFANCAELIALDVSELTSVGFSAFVGCTKFAPEALPKLTNTEEYAFSGTAITSIELPATLTHIADNLFNGCEQLTTVTLSAKSVGNSAFEGCVLLNSVTISGTELIGKNAFKGCESLASLALPATVIRVGEGAFEGTNLISTEGGVKYAGEVAIGIEKGTTTITLKSGTMGIADGAFRKTDVTSVSLDSVRFIGVDAFRGCEKLGTVTFTQSVKYIGANSFRESGLTTVTVPATVESVGDNAFYDCQKLTSVNVSAATIGKFAFSYTGVNRDLDHPVKVRPSYAKLTSVTLGEGVKVIGSNAFQYCPITSITLSASLEEIGMYAFAQTDLTGVTIPANVKFIGQYAFYESKITTATFADTQGWKAGKTSLNVGTPATNATYLKTTYLDYDWIKEEQR